MFFFVVQTFVRRLKYVRSFGDIFLHTHTKIAVLIRPQKGQRDAARQRTTKIYLLTSAPPNATNRSMIQSSIRVITHHKVGRATTEGQQAAYLEVPVSYHEHASRSLRNLGPCLFRTEQNRPLPPIRPAPLTGMGMNCCTSTATRASNLEWRSSCRLTRGFLSCVQETKKKHCSVAIVPAKRQQPARNLEI